MARNWFIDLVRQFFFLIDKIIYYFIELVYSIINEVSRISILSQDSIEEFAIRIYFIIGIFILFKTMFSLITMFVNPDSFYDAKAGGGKLVRKIMTSLLLLAFVPTIFQLLFQFQAVVLDNNILPSIVLGGDYTPERKEEIKENYSNAGRVIATTIFKGFFTPEFVNKEPQFYGCDLCKLTYNGPVVENPVSAYGDVLNKSKDGTYIFNYSIIIASIAGGLAAYIMLVFLFFIAARSIKLAFLQLIAPIPIIASIDPKKGDTVLNNWVSNVTSTYIDLFMRLMILYFVIFIITEITSGPSGTVFTFFKAGTSDVSSDTSFLAGVFIILGLLNFAKDAPNLVYDILGIKKPAGGLGMNPLKQLMNTPLAGKAAAFGIGGATSAMKGKGFMQGAKKAASAVPLFTGSDKAGWKNIAPDMFGDEAKKAATERKQKQKNTSRGKNLMANRFGQDFKEQFKSGARPLAEIDDLKLETLKNDEASYKAYKTYADSKAAHKKLEERGLDLGVTYNQLKSANPEQRNEILTNGGYVDAATGQADIKMFYDDMSNTHKLTSDQAAVVTKNEETFKKKLETANSAVQENYNSVDSVASGLISEIKKEKVAKEISEMDARDAGALAIAAEARNKQAATKQAEADAAAESAAAAAAQESARATAESDARRKAEAARRAMFRRGNSSK